jgi:hypothetical protein
MSQQINNVMAYQVEQETFESPATEVHLLLVEGI